MGYCQALSKKFPLNYIISFKKIITLFQYHTKVRIIMDQYKPKLNLPNIDPQKKISLLHAKQVKHLNRWPPLYCLTSSDFHNEYIVTTTQRCFVHSREQQALTRELEHNIGTHNCEIAVTTFPVIIMPPASIKYNFVERDILPLKIVMIISYKSPTLIK